MKRVAIFLLLILLTITIVSATGVEIKLDKNEYFQLELLQAEILGNFPNGLDEENIGIFRDENVHESPVNSGLTKTGSKYLYYAILPQTIGNYSIKIQDTEYSIFLETSDEEIQKNFTILKSEDPYLSIDKGFIIAKDDFSVTVRSLNAIQEITAEFEATGEVKNLEIPYNGVKTLRFSIDNISKYTESILNIEDYKIPVFVFAEDNTSNGKRIILEDSLKILPEEIEAKLRINREYELFVIIKNIDKDIIKDLKISTNLDEIEIDPESISELEHDEKKTILLKVMAKDDLDGYLRFSIDDSSLQIPIKIRITDDEEEVDVDIVRGETCEELEGEVCQENQKCDKITYTQGEICCISGCIEDEPSDNTWIFGVLLLIVLIIIGFFIYSKMKKEGKIKPFSEKLRDRNKKFENRINPKPENEVKRSLSKI